MKYLHRIFLVLLTMETCLAAEAMEDEETMTIDSTEVQYDGNKVLLNGEVVLEHELGTIYANEVIMTSPAGEKKFRLGTFDMNKNVKFVLSEGGQLTCARAQLDYQTLIGRFYGDADQEFVIYVENCRDKTNPARWFPLIVKSRQMILHINRGGGSASSKQKTYISDIVAENQVTVNYNHDFIAAADYATYQRQTSQAESSQNRAMPGLITLRAFDVNGICQVTNRNGDLITANQIGIDTQKQQICFSYPKGSLFTAQEGRHIERVDFSSDTLLWDDKNDVMTLREHVAINQKGVGRLTTEDEVKFYQHQIEGKNQIGTIESTGKTVLTRTDEDKDLSHVVTCYGKLVVDHIHLAMTMESPLDDAGNVLEGQQVFYQDPMGEIFADKALIEYEMVGKTITPKKLTLIGHVRLLDNTEVQKGAGAPLTKYALSDKLEYYPSQKEVVFTADQGRRVLFYSQANDLQVSAPALKIKRDEVTHKKSIKGVGDVRFSFIEHEFDQLKEKFSLGQTSKKNPSKAQQER